jgi:hypothetical protein
MYDIPDGQACRAAYSRDPDDIAASQPCVLQAENSPCRAWGPGEINAAARANRTWLGDRPSQNIERGAARAASVMTDRGAAAIKMGSVRPVSSPPEIPLAKDPAVFDWKERSQAELNPAPLVWPDHPDAPKFAPPETGKGTSPRRLSPSQSDAIPTIQSQTHFPPRDYKAEMTGKGRAWPWDRNSFANVLVGPSGLQPKDLPSLLIPLRKAGFQAAPGIGSSVNLECRPPLDGKDRNPVVKTFVNLSFKNGHEVQEFSVIHELFDGRKIDRSNQYTGTATHVPGQNEWSWSGRLDSNRSITMEARVFRNSRDEWWYEENVFKNGQSDGAIQFRCVENEGGD